MTLASTIIDEIEVDLSDSDNDKWAESEHLVNLNEAERQLVAFLPTAYTVTKVYQLAEGTRQSLPDGTASYQDPSSNTLPQAIEMVKITRNMGTTGLVDGTAITVVEKAVLDEFLPSWHTATASATVEHYTFDQQDRTEFFVYPPQPSSSMGWVESVYSAVPTALTATSDSINLHDTYIDPIKHFMKFKAYAKDAKISEFAAARASAEWNLFLTLIGRKDLIERQYVPRVSDGNIINSVQR